MTHRRAIELLTNARIPFPAVVPCGTGQEQYHVYGGVHLLGKGLTIADAMENAKYYWGNAVRLPPFIAEDYTVVRSGEVEATAKSKTMAMRIANALNVYNTDERDK